MLISDQRSRVDVAHGFLQAAEGDDVHSVLVTSCHRGEGKTTIAVNVARSLAEEAGRRVLLVDANVERPRLHDHFGIAKSPGFLDVLSGVQPVQGDLAEQSFRLMPIGSGYADTGTMVLSRQPGRLRSFFDVQKESSDFVILDGSSVFGTSNPAPIARACDGVLLVIECEKTRWEVVRSARDQLRQVGAKILGVVLNKRRYYIPRSIYG